MAVAQGARSATRDAATQAPAGDAVRPATLDPALAESAVARLLWQGLPVLLAVVDAEGRLGATNPVWQALLGLPARQLHGQAVVGLVHADDQAATRRWLRRVFGGGGPATLDARWRRADGGHLRLHWRLALRDGLGCAVGQPWPVPGTSPLLHDAVHARQVRQHSLRSVARLTSGVSHDFNNLLQVLRNTLELIHQRPGDAPQVAARAMSALGIVERGAQMSTQLLAFAGALRLAPQAVEVAPLVQRLQGRLLALLHPHTTLQLQMPAEGALATADLAQLEQALLNLVRNAADAMPQGGRLAIHLGRAHVQDDPELATGDYITIDVHDSGAGMHAAVRDRAVEPFFTTKAPGRGRGLGLSQVHGFAQQCGGTVRLQPPGGGMSRREGGSGQPGTHCVRLLLPAAAETRP